jgi:cysteinyl-tRNA synthetase
MPLQIFNSLNHRLEEFKPIKKKTVGLYTCGPTVYNYAHIGNLRTYVFEDVLKRIIITNGYKVKHVINITDVGHLTSDADEGEDKMEKGSRREGKTAWELANFYITAFEQDLSDLNVIPPDIWCRATEHIEEQINLIKKLEKNGFTYQTADGIYFNTSKFPNYGKMANLKNQTIKAGLRVDLGDKKNPTDFALWKFSSPEIKRQMEWKSPWGTGFPGWHIECSAMSTKYLGQPFDIHCGGIDHIPVHHINEIAQSEAAIGKPLANYWLHGEFLIISALKCPKCNQEFTEEKPTAHTTTNLVHYMKKCQFCGEPIGHLKMSKSENNFITLQTISNKGLSALAYRYFLLQTHYRKQLNFSFEALQAAANGYERLKQIVASLRTETKNTKETENTKKYYSQFKDYINDDLNTPQALALAWKIVDKKELATAEKLWLIKKFDEVFGLKLDTTTQPEKLPAKILTTINERNIARTQKNWTKSDELRKVLENLGYTVEDTPAGTKVKKR